MHISGMRVKAVALWIMTAALLMLAFVTVFAIARSRSLAAAENTLSGIYQKAFYETCELTQSIAVELGKLPVADGAARERILSDISQQAQGAQSDLALLPLGSAATASTIKFINQAGDFASSLHDRLASGGEITDEDLNTIAELTDAAGELTLGLSALLERYESGEATFSGEIADADIFSPITDPAAEYPTLLYDGPFSDGRTGDDFKALEGLDEISSDDAAKVLKSYMDAENISFDGENIIGTAVYEFSFASHGREMYAAVTKKGGMALYVMCVSGAENEVKSVPECIASARTFLAAHGYGQMELSYYSVYNCVMTLNFAALQSDVVMYPDLIKIQVAMDDGRVIGMEAGSYLRNHVQRVIEKPALTEADARNRLSGRLTAKSARLCFIPSGTGERMCWEIAAEGADGEFLIYIDAMTGAQAEIMSVVDSSAGKLVM